MTIFKHLALAALCKADTFYTDPSKIDREAISEFRNLFERNFCSGNQSAPCPDGGNKVCANDGWTYSSACDFKISLESNIEKITMTELLSSNIKKD